jgi:hypothetical protein
MAIPVIPKSPLAEAIAAHWAAMQRQSIEVPEWGCTVWFDPLTLAERDKLRHAQGNEALAETLILKAEDEAGTKLFTKADKPQLMHGAAPATVARVAERMLVADCVAPERLGEP